MKVTVHLNRIKIPYKEEFNILVEYFKKHGVDLKFTFKNVSVLGYKSVYNDSVKRYLIMGTEKLVLIENADVDIFVFDHEEWANPKGSKFPLKPETPNGCCYQVGNKPFITVGVYKKMDYHQVAHELMHALRMIENIKGNPVKDVMDTYRDDADWDSPTGNFAEQWSLFEMPEVTLKRMDDDGIQTLGQLFYKDFECKTLERPWKDNKPNISCIPKGEYMVKYTFSPKFMKNTYLLQGTGKRSGIRIHSGNYFFDIQGCILLGDSYSDINKDGRVDVINSRVTVKKFEDLLGKKDFKLKII